MKYILSLVCFLVISKASIAQKDSLAIDDHGKYIYYKVVNLEKYNADTLYSRAQYFFKNGYDKNTLKLAVQDNKNTSITGLGAFPVSKRSGLARHQDGAVSYKLIVEVKGTKYRYWLTDFIFTPYHRDRYNNYIADNGLVIPFEVLGKKISSKDMDDYFDQTAAFSKQLGDKLKQYMLQGNLLKKDASPKVISINKW